MRRGTLITIIALLVLIAAFAAMQILGLTSERRPAPPTPSPTATQP